MISFTERWFRSCVIAGTRSETDNVLYAAVGLAGETGEVCDLIKKTYRLGARHRPLDVDELASELGDVLFYVAALANAYGIDLEEIIAIHCEKRHSLGLSTGEFS